MGGGEGVNRRLEACVEFAWARVVDGGGGGGCPSISAGPLVDINSLSSPKSLGSVNWEKQCTT